MASPLIKLTLDQLRCYIDQPQLRNGGRLPPETTLATELSVSRPILRKALESLRKEGRIESRRGSGTFVKPGKNAEFSVFGEPKNLGEIENCLRFRSVIESAAASDAARAGDTQLIQKIEKKIFLMDSYKAKNISIFEADFAFHLSVAEAAKNNYYALTLQFLKPHIKMGYLLGRHVHGIPQEKRSQRVINEHQKVLETIISGDPMAASQAMSDHLDAGIDRIFGQQK